MIVDTAYESFPVCLTFLFLVYLTLFVYSFFPQCWTYIRVAVHGIHVTPYGKNPATVAVGDTFLFSSHRSALAAHVGGSVATHISGSAHPSDRLLLQGDGCCITHPLPYYRCLPGAGAEEQTSRRLLACTKSIHM